MKTAVLITGQARTFARCYASQKWQIYRKLINPHFFVSVSDDDDAGDMVALKDHFENVVIEIVKQPTFDPDQRYENARRHAPYAPSVPTSSILAQFWALKRVWELMKEHSHPAEFASFLRVRPDSFVQSFDPIETRNIIYTPWWGSYGGVNDRFAYIYGWHSAARYFSTFDHVPELIEKGCPMHPESLLAASLEMQGANVSQTLDAEVITLRKPGDKRGDSYPVYYAGDPFRYAAAIRRD